MKVDFEYLFEMPKHELSSEDMEALRQRKINGYLTKTIKSGSLLELESYPVWDTGRKGQIMEKTKGNTPEAMKWINARNSKKQLIRLISANFEPGKDVFVTLTYAGRMPNEKQAYKDVRNYIRRVRAYREKNGLSELKYIYVTEKGETMGRIHHHVIMSGIDRVVSDALWGERGFVNSQQIRAFEAGLIPLGNYMGKRQKAENQGDAAQMQLSVLANEDAMIEMIENMPKDTAGSRRWCNSKNLIRPKPTVAHKKMSRRRASSIVTHGIEQAKRVFEKMYPDYDFLDCVIKTSPFVGGAYIYARMNKRRQENGKGIPFISKHNTG